MTSSCFVILSLIVFHYAFRFQEFAVILFSDSVMSVTYVMRFYQNNHFYLNILSVTFVIYYSYLNCFYLITFYELQFILQKKYSK